MDAQTVLAIIGNIAALIIGAVTLWSKSAARIEAMRAQLEEKIDDLHKRVNDTRASVKDVQIHVSEHYIAKTEATKMERTVIAAIEELRKDIKEHTKSMTALQVTLKGLNDRLTRIEGGR